jgi:hypothetical protein
MDKKIVDYTIMRNNDSAANLSYGQFISAIRNKIKEGWQPFGAPYIDSDKGESQAMVRYE